MYDEHTLVGRIVDVQGASLVATLLSELDEWSPVVTIGDEDVLVGRLGSYVLIIQSGIETLAVVTRMVEQEKLPPVTSLPSGGEQLAIPLPERSIRLTPVGTWLTDGQFRRGVTLYPTTGAEVHVVNPSHLNRIFDQYARYGFDIGRHAYNDQLRAFLNPSSLLARHFAVVGQTGAGKSWTVASLVQRILREMPFCHIVVLDIHGEYSWVDGGNRQNAFAETGVRYVDATELEVPYWLMSFAEICDLFVDVTETTAHNQVAFLRDTIQELRNLEKAPLLLERVTVDTPVYFDVGVLRKMVEDENERMVPGQSKPIRGPLFGAFDRFLIRLDSKLNDVRYDFLLKPKTRTNSVSLESLLRDFVGLGLPQAHVTILDLSAVPFDVRPIVTAQIGRLAFEFNYWNPNFRNFPIALIAEEAHAYIPRSDAAQYAGARKSMERIAKEGRKYGVSLGVVSQRPHEVSATVLAQCGTFICLRMTNPEDQAFIRHVVPEAERDLVDTLAALGRGEAVVLGEAVPIPARILVDAPTPTPRSDDVDFYEKWRVNQKDLDVTLIVDRWRRQRK
jgi:DNA helicase HerA-like ATPase